MLWLWKNRKSSISTSQRRRDTEGDRVRSEGEKLLEVVSALLGRAGEEASTQTEGRGSEAVACGEQIWERLLEEAPARGDPAPRGHQDGAVSTVFFQGPKLQSGGKRPNGFRTCRLLKMGSG